MRESGNDNQVPQKGKSSKGSKPRVERDKPSGNENGGEAAKKNNATKEKTSSEYFKKDERPKMTVVFHAILAPHFKFEKGQGDRIFMRFGGVVFGNFNEDVVEVYPER